ncbi:MND1-interacting protein 1 [Platanthera guangdongensis]|uniref:MND1-interacting protein 1 n=1 Tax=Platanthera guangdongensis TaxID=2320717 RepID=A0ABR2LQY9_9ASPA
MGLSAREKPFRAGAAGRKRHVPRPAAVQSLPSESTVPKILTTAFPTTVPSPEPSLNLNLSPASNPKPRGFDESGWGYCTEQQLEEIVIDNLDCIYKDAISRLISLGYDDTAVLRAVLCNGHCYGAMDAVSNIIQNALAYLNTEAAAMAADGDPPAGGFSDLRNLEEYSLAGMVCLLQQIRPDLSRGEAMWCLLMSGLHVSGASTIELPSLSFPANLQSSSAVSASLASAAPFPFAVTDRDSTGTEPASATHTPEITNNFDSRPLLKSILKQHNAEYCPELKMQGRQRQQIVEEEGEDLVQLVLKRLEAMRIEDDKYPDKDLQDQKKEMIMDLIRQIRELEGQVKERKDWAQQKAAQAARKLSGDLHELRVLRLEREDNLRTMKGKQALEDSTMNRLAEMESALKKTSAQVDRANVIVRKLETENAEIRAELEASKLSASESVTACVEVSKREKRCLKKLVAWEKQKEKMQEEIVEKRKKIVQVQQQLAEVKESTKQVEVGLHHLISLRFF